MGLFDALNTGISGLGTHGTALSVIGDNVANMNTVGFKGGSTRFEDLVMNKLGGGRGDIGSGARTAGVVQSFHQGALEQTSSNTDLAIDGRGFFVVQDPNGASYYTRAGQFQMAESGELQDFAGRVLQGYTVDASGGLTTSVGDLVIPRDPIPGNATTELTLNANLTSPNPTPSPVPTIPTIVPGDTFSTVTSAATFSTSTVVYDSLGAAHEVTLAFFNTGAGTWDYAAYVDAGETGGTSGEPLQVGTGSIAFDTDGNLDAAASTIGAMSVTFTGASAQTIDFDFGQGTGDSGLIQGLAGGSSVNSVDPNGNGSGSLIGFEVEGDGVVTGTYSNGEQRTLGQVVTATFRSEQGLERVGANLYAATTASGEPAVGEPGTGGRGQTWGYALEMSNVDLEQEFVKMIRTQRGYQAGTRVVSSVDDMLQELVQIV